MADERLMTEDLLAADVARIAKESEKGGRQKKERNLQRLAEAFLSEPTERAFGALCERINWGLRQFIFKVVKDNEATTEVLAKTLESIYYKKDQYDPSKSKFSTWMYRIAFNNSLKYMQSLRRQAGRQLDYDIEDLYDSCLDTDGEGGAAAPVCTSEIVDIEYDRGTGEYVTYRRDDVIDKMYNASVECIEDLPDNLRIVMRERLVNKKKIDDIAQDNKLPITSVKNWVRRGRIELGELIKQKHSYLYSMYSEFGSGM